jgi:hypothetical protein
MTPAELVHQVRTVAAQCPTPPPLEIVATTGVDPRNSPWTRSIDWHLSYTDDNEPILTVYVADSKIGAVFSGCDWWYGVETYGDSCKGEEDGKAIISKLFQQDCYRLFLDSPQWKRLRNLKLTLNPWCQGCNNYTLAAEAHHLSYENGWLCDIADLESLCSDCHKKEHAPNQTVATVEGKTEEPTSS